MLRDDRLYILKGLAFGEGRQITAAVLVCLFLLQEGTENAVNLPPALGQNTLTLRREDIAAAIEGGRDGLILIRTCRCTQQLAAYQQEQIALAYRQGPHIRLFDLHCGDDGVMVGYILVRYHELHQGVEIAASIEGRHLRRQMDHTGGRFCHVGGQIPAVRSRIGQQLLFIEALGVIKGLLRRVPENAVCLPLQGGQVIELRGLFLLFLTGDGSTYGLPILTSGLYLFRHHRIGELLRNCLGSIHLQAHMMVFLFLKEHDLPVALHQHCQGRRLDAPHIQGAVVEDREKTGSIDWMYTKLSIPERLKDLRVVDKHLTLEQLAEQTGLSRSALGKYESDDYKDISPFAIATLAEFYGVSTDYLMGLSENKNHPNTELQALHLSDDMVELLSSGRINNRLLCELATHPNFQRLMVDMEIFIDRIADMRVEQMNLILEATRQTVINSHAPGENDLYMRTLELGQIQESDFFSHVLHDDLDSIVRDIREAHLKDKTTADPQPTLEDVKEQFEQAVQQGSDIEMLIHEFCDKLQIPFEKISSEDFSAFLRILSLSKMLKNPNNMRGKAKPQPYYSPKRKKRR